MSIKDYYETFKIEVCHNIDADTYPRTSLSPYEENI